MFGSERVSGERKGVFGGRKKGLWGYNRVFGVKMGCFGVFVGEQVCLGVKRGVGV